MTTFDSTPRRRPDGSIDTQFYMAQGRRARAQQAHRIVSALAPEPASPSTRRFSVFPFF